MPDHEIELEVWERSRYGALAGRMEVFGPHDIHLGEDPLSRSC